MSQTLNVEEILIGYKDSQITEIRNLIDNNMRYRFASHERIFRMILNVTTVFLTGWVALITWKGGMIDKNIVHISLSLGFHVLSLILITISDFLLITQTKIGEKVLDIIKRHLAEDRIILKSKLIGLREENDADKVKAILNDHEKMYIEKMESYKLNDELLRANQIGKYFWKVGIASGIVFFLSLIVSLYSVIKYVQLAI